MRWKYAVLIEKIAMAKNIIAIWLKVLKAMIFFKSCSQLAEIPARSIVREEIVKISKRISGWGEDNVRSKRKTPAVTRVEEWTKAETGVGAAIAAGSHALNGIWALFENAAIRRRNKIRKGKCSEIISSQVPREIKIPIARIIVMSPTRFERMVSAPDSLDLKFW